MIKLRCQYCDSEFESKKSRGKFCCADCQNASHSKRMKGNGNSNYKGIKKTAYNCETCDSIFYSHSKSARFCSRSCNGKRPENRLRLAELAPIISKLPRKPREKIGMRCTCKACGVEFRSEKKEIYCNEHKGKFFGGKEIITPTCTVCGSEFKLPTKNKRLTCSDYCKSKAQTDRQDGDKSHLWKGGLTSAAMIVRNSKEYKAWRLSVFDRDGYTCVTCGQVGGKLNADHIKPFSTHHDLRLDIDNGRTLCLGCHLKTDTWGRKALSYRP